MIGIIDSGYGGLSVVAELNRQNKALPFIYLGDNARNPYGTRTKETITTYGRQMIDYLLAYDPSIQTIIIACNTLCAAALPELHALYPNLIIQSIMHYGALGALMSFDHYVSVMATTFTVTTNAYKTLIQQYDTTMHVEQIDAQSLVAMVETQQIDWQQIELLSRQISDKTDTLVLGCTHFPFLYDVLRALLSKNVQIIDPAVGCVADLAIKQDIDWQQKSQYLTTGSLELFQDFVKKNNLPTLPIDNITLTRI